MLILARKVGQSIMIGDNIKITVIGIRGEQMRIGVDAPKSITVLREELWEQIGANDIGSAVQNITTDSIPDVLQKK